MKGHETAIERKAIVRDVVKRINKRMKLIGEELGIGNITTYTARHSYATVLKRSGANISYISESLGTYRPEDYGSISGEFRERGAC